MDDETADRPGEPEGLPILVKLIIAFVIMILVFVILIDILGFAGVL